MEGLRHDGSTVTLRTSGLSVLIMQNSLMACFLPFVSDKKWNTADSDDTMSIGTNYFIIYLASCLILN